MATDTHFMAQALALAEQALFITSPNPRVGCVLVDAQARVLGQGHTQAVGGPHAEIMALRDAQQQGHDVRGCTAYVTLEPCAHHGRTGPCCEALIQAGVARVVAAMTDPFPEVAGRGFARLRDAGIQVDVGLGHAQAQALNVGFFHRVAHGVPWVRLKVAASLDGQTALNNGASQWITSESARADAHVWRARACAILTGIGTVLEDDPLLNVRGVDTPRQPPLVVVDSRLQTPPEARLFSAGRAVWIYHASEAHSTQAEALRARGAELVALPGAGHKVDLPALMRALGQRQINELHVEAGHKLNGSLLREGCVHELLVYLAPLLMGQGRGMSNLGPLNALGEALPMSFVECTPIGPDLRLRAHLR